MLMEQRATRMICVGWSLLAVSAAIHVLLILIGSHNWPSITVWMLGLVVSIISIRLLYMYYRIRQTLKEIRLNRRIIS